MSAPLHFGTPRRVQILTVAWPRYFKPGQFAYAISSTTKGGMWCQDTDEDSVEGETTYLVSKTKDMRGGALWFSKNGLRFTRRR